MIVKTSKNPLGLFKLGNIEEKLVSDFSELVRERTAQSTVVSGIPESNTLEISELPTAEYDTKLVDTAITANNAGMLEYVKRDILTRARPTRVNTHTLVLSPFGNTETLGADGSGLAAVYPKLGLAKPTAKLKKFFDLEQRLYDNMQLISNTSIRMAHKDSSQSERLTLMITFESIVASYVGFLNSLNAHYNYTVKVGPEIGLANQVNALINDYDVQTTIGEITTTIASMPILDIELFDQVRALSKYYFTQKRAVGRPTVYKATYGIGTTSATLDLDAVANYELLPVESPDTAWVTTLAGLMYTDTSLHGWDRISLVPSLADIFFFTSFDATQKAALKTLLGNILSHVNSLKRIYRHYIQYLRMGMGKGWITPRTAGEWIDLELGEDGSVGFREEEITFDYMVHTLSNYAPLAMHIEGTANSAGTRIHCPILINSTGNAVETKSALGSVCREVSHLSLSGKDSNLAELASWGTWLIYADESTASETALEPQTMSFYNPYHGMFILNALYFQTIDAAGAITSTNTQYPLAWVMENVNNENIVPTFLVNIAAYTFNLSSQPLEDSAAEQMIQAGAWSWLNYILNCAGHERKLIAAETDAGTVNFWIYKLDDNGAFYTNIPVVAFVQAAAQYYNAVPMVEVQPFERGKFNNSNKRQSTTVTD